VLGIGLVILMILALITVLRGKAEVVPMSDRLVHDLPQGEWAVPGTGEPLVVGAGQLGVVVLDVRMANFSIIPAPTGTPVRLEADYDSGSYKLDESFNSSGELGWTYRLEFGKRSMFDFIQIDSDNRLELYLPAGTPIALKGEIGIGETRVELGGLWIESVNLSVGIGGHEIDFNEALATPMKNFDVRGSIGELRIRSLGNASPATVSVSHSIGELDVSLAGTWQNDSTVSIRSTIGECRIGVPDRGIGFELIGAPVTLGESNTRRARGRDEVPEDAPVVKLEASQRIGELILTR
jgi:hypothetical protein